jgi:protein gp37
MSDYTSIEWTDASWVMVTGCDHVSPGCGLARPGTDDEETGRIGGCYSAKLTSGRLKHRPEYEGLAVGGRFTGEVRMLPDRLELPLKWRKPRKIFVCDMADLFHEKVDAGFIAQVWAVMAACPQHTFQVLTKRHARMRSLLSSTEFVRGVREALNALLDKLYENGKITQDIAEDIEAAPWPMQNVWCGVSAENQYWADRRIPALLSTPAAVRWVSAEPLLGPIDLGWVNGIDTLRPDWVGGSGGGSGAPHPLLDWIVTGGESGPKARPAHPDWFRSIRDQCTDAGVHYFHKQNGAWAPVVPDTWENRRETDWQVRHDGYAWPLAEPHGSEDGTEVTVRKVGKKAAGRLLDGREWNEFPHPQPAAVTP